MRTFFSALVLLSCSVALAGNDHHPQVKLTPEFEKMKALLGTWKGKANMHGKDEDLKVTYELTSGGTAIVEKMNPGTPMEMMTVFANNGKKVNATHYCMVGNQPVMTLKKSDDHSFSFEMVGTQGLSDKNEMHMHAVTLTVEGDKLKQEWTNYDHGKKGQNVVFELKKD